MENINSFVADSSTDGSNDLELIPSDENIETIKNIPKVEFQNDMIDNILNIRNESKEIKENFIKRNKFYEEKVNDKMKMNINYEKDFKDHLQKKLNKLDNRLNILQMKYSNYKLWYDRFNILR